MKIRTDFVTNSSSSSFCTISISGVKLTEILKKYKDLLESLEFIDDISVDDSGFFLCNGEDGFCEGPADESSMASSFIELIQELTDSGDDSEDLDELIEELEGNEEEINRTITFLDWTRCDTGWGGDSESRIWHDYDENFIRRYMGLADDAEITKEIEADFRDKVADATSLETTTWHYDGKQFEITEEFELQ